MPRRPVPFDLAPGDLIADKYRVIAGLGGGWEGEVYKVREVPTGIVRAAKLFYPERNPRGRAARHCARKLHALAKCPIVIQFHVVETVEFEGRDVTLLLSDFVEGELLSEFLKRFRGNRLRPYEALHLLHALVRGVEAIHRAGEYHGDLHSDNIIVSRFGLEFDLRLVDVYRRHGTGAQNRRDDICDLVYVFYEALGGQKAYARHPKVVKTICCGLKRTLILRKFPTSTRLREHLEALTI